MDIGSLVGPVLGDVAKAAGLLSAAGELNAGWFEAPLPYLESVLTDTAQRGALLDLLDQVLPPAAVPGAPQGQKWHPLLGTQPPATAQATGNVYLTVDDSAGPEIRLGLAGQYGSAGGPPGASVIVALPVADIAGTTFTAIAGTGAGPLTATVAVTLGWVAPAQALTLAGVSVTLVLAPLASPAIADVQITLQGLDLDGTGARDVVLDPRQLRGEATQLILALVRQQLLEISGSAAGEAAALATHLIPLLGLDGSLPAFPFASIAADPTALPGWLRSLLTGTPAPMQDWLGHLAGLMGVAAPAVTVSADETETSWSVTLFSPAASSSIGLSLTQSIAADGVTPQLDAGLAVDLAPAGASPPARLAVSATVLRLPLAGTAEPEAFPAASIVLAAPGSPGQQLIPAGSAVPFSAGSARAGLQWSDGALAPVLELRDVVISPASFPVIDLTNAATAASAAVSAALAAALGSTGPGAHLAALAGVAEPAADPSAPLADPLHLATHPTATIAGLHRAALLSAAHPWSAYFGELAGLLGLTASPGTAGTFAAPWSAQIAATGPLTLNLVAWNAQASASTADPQLLRLGVQLAAGSPAASATLTAELLGFDLPASGPAKVTVLGGLHARAQVALGAAAAEVSGISLSATSLEAALDLAAGSAPVLSASITGLTITTPAGPITVPAVTFPFPAGLDLANPAAALGIGAADLEKLLAALVAHVLGAELGSAGLAVAVLLGCTAGIPGLPADFPVLADPAGPGSLFGDPLGALRAWLASVATGLSADGTSFAATLAAWPAALLGQTLPGDLATAPSPSGLAGSGSYDDPWLLPLGTPASPATGLAWLEPDGPPSTAALAAAAISAATDLAGLTAALADAGPYLPQIPPSLGVPALASGLQVLSDQLASSDGVVPVASQVPADGTWTTGTPIGAAHHLQPADPSAGAQILAQVDAWAAPGNPRVILLLGPAFSDHATWAALLGQAEAAQPGSTSAAATFNLRVAGVAPASVDLRGVTVTADYYTADLQDDGSGDVAGLAAQIGLVQARLAVLRPGAPLILVAHSTGGLAALAYLQASPGQVTGLITLGTPFSGAPLTPLTDPAAGDALRACAHLFPPDSGSGGAGSGGGSGGGGSGGTGSGSSGSSGAGAGGIGLEAGPLRDALTHLLLALDGYLPPATPGGLPAAWPYPVGDFAGAALTDTGGVPALALGGQLGGSAGVSLLSSLQATATATLGAVIVAAPTHLAFGVRAALPLGADGQVAVDASMRLDAGRVALHSGAPEPARPAHALTVTVGLSRPGGWLVGGPLSYAGPAAAPVSTRVRSAELRLAITPSGSATNGAAVAGTPSAALREASFRGATSDVVGWTDPEFQPLLGSVFDANAATPPPAGSSLAGLLDAFQALGIAAGSGAGDSAAGSGGAMTISADAINALTVDSVGYLGSRAIAALAPLGFTSVAGAYTLPLAGLPLEIFAQAGPALVGLRSTGSAIVPAAGASLEFSAGLALATLTPDVSVTMTAGQAALTYAAGTLTLQIPPELPSLQLYPVPPAGTIEAALAAAVPTLLVSVSAAALLESVLGPGYVVSGIGSFLSDPGQWLIRGTALGNGTVLDPTRISQLLALLGTLPAGLTLSAAGTSPTTVSLATTPGQPLGGVLDLSLRLSIDATRHLTPAGSIGITANLGGTWPSVTLTFGVSASGITLTVTPGVGAPIELLPVFGGAAALAGAAEALLPQALDKLRTALPPGPILPLALDVATALDLYDAAGGFAAHADQLTALLSGRWFGGLPGAARTAFLAAVAAVFNDPSSPLHGALPGTVAVSGATVNWSYPLPAGLGTGALVVAVGWDASGPTVTVSAQDVAPVSGPVALSLLAGFAGGALVLDVAAGVSLQALGISVVPQLVLGLDSSGLRLAFLPLGSGSDATLAITVLPVPQVTAAAGAAAALLDGYAIPLAADLLIAATGTGFGAALWTGGPTIEHVLAAAGIITVTGPSQYALAAPLPDVGDLTGGLLQAVAPVTIALTGGAGRQPLQLEFIAESGQIGVRLLGSVAVSGDGTPQVSVLFGAPATWLGPDAGITLYLFTTDGGLQFRPRLVARGLGIGLAGGAGEPLLNESGFRIGAVDGYLALEIDLTSGTVSGLGGGLEIDKLGLPISQFDSASSSNPVAASLLDSGGSAGGSSGDDTAVNPAVDVIAYCLDELPFVLQFAGLDGPVVIPVHASFGPIYLDQIDLARSGTDAVSLGIDGSVKIAGLDVSVIELALIVPLAYLTSPGHWSLDLQGLAVAFSQDPIEITGGLNKSPGPPVEYDGMLSVSIADLGLTVVGSYSRPSDAQGEFTSLFMFVSLGEPLGGPPFAFVMGLGGGFGYNRELIVPTDLDKIDSFVLVSAIDDSSLADDPMGALLQMGTAIPARRGAFWIAAGVRFTTFELINSTVVVAVALDRGFEIDILGVSRMALPAEDVALVSVELALKARFNAEEGVLSVQAQLTDNSYIFSPDCQLTGGFAFFVWYPQGQFVLTLGGYNPAFTKPAEFPDVPRLGFNWSVSDDIVIKGGSYFALTNSCVMAGGSLSATAGFGGVRAWFDAYLDFLVAWDPFAYEFDVGVEIGASLSIQVCFFGCVTIGVTVSLGAQLSISGPPFHGTASIDAYVTTITVSFGDPPQPPPYITDFGVFAGKYLTAGDADGTAVSLQINAGLLVPDPPGAQPRPGTRAQPWQVGTEFSVTTTTRMPATSTTDFVFGNSASPIAGLNALDIAPMDLIGVTSAHTLSLERQQDDGSWQPAVIDQGAAHFTITAARGPFPEATWHWVDPQHLPAAARTITAVAGFKVDAHVEFNDQSALIPISTLVDDDPRFALPLPFATTAQVSTVLQGYGAAAESIATDIARASSAAMLTASVAVLAGGGVFAQNRAQFGLPPAGLGPLAVAALRGTRSAPPLVAPITTGLTMDPVGLPPPNTAQPLPPVGAVLLEQPRLRAVLTGQPQAAADVPAAPRTSVGGLNVGGLNVGGLNVGGLNVGGLSVGGLSVSASASAAGVPRMRPPVPATVAGARLVIVPAAAAPRPTRAAVRSRVVRNADLGAVAGPAQQQAVARAAADLIGGGVTLGAGAAHLWDLPAGQGRAFTLTGSGCARMISTDRSGAILADVELTLAGVTAQQAPDGTAQQAPDGTVHQATDGTVHQASGGTVHQASGGTVHRASGGAVLQAPGGAVQQVPDGTEMVLIQALGEPAGPALDAAGGVTTGNGAGGTAGTAGFGVISAAFAPAGHAPAVGWQAGSTLLQLGPTRFAGRGATVRVPRAHAGWRSGQRASYAAVAARDVAAGQAGVETTLPAGVGVVIVALDLTDPTAAQSGDLAVGCTGGTLATPPSRVGAGNRRLLCYDVATRDPGADALTISVASARGWTVGAVAGVPGTALEWAAALSGGLPDGFVPDGPITPGGSVTASYAPGGIS